MARLYADEDFPRPVVEELRNLGHDVLTVHEAGQGGQGIPDSEVLTYAISQGRAVVTRNRRDYIRLHAAVQPHAGVIVCTDDKDVVRQASRIHQALASCSDLTNLLIRVNRPPIP